MGATMSRDPSWATEHGKIAIRRLARESARCGGGSQMSRAVDSQAAEKRWIHRDNIRGWVALATTVPVSFVLYLGSSCSSIGRSTS